MSDNLVLKAKKRDLSGAKPNAIRAEGSVPAVVHDHGKDSHHIVVEDGELARVFHSAGKHHTVELDVEGKKFTTLIKEVTYKPASHKTYHAVFQAVKANEKVSAEIPLRLGEDIPAAKASLLIVNGIDHVEVEALPKDLIDFIEVDASSLVEAGDKITVASVNVPDGVVIKTDPEAVIAHVETPKDQVAEADAAAAELAEADAGKPTEEPTTEETSAEPKTD